MPKLTIEINERDWQLLRERAAQHRCRPNELAREVLTKWLRQADTEQLTRAEQMLDEWWAEVEHLLHEANIDPAEIEADITAAYEEYRSRCSQ